MPDHLGDDMRKVKDGSDETAKEEVKGNKNTNAN